MLRDRGTIKWTSMMLPEHVKMIREWADNDQNEQQVNMDEQRMEEWNDVLLLAMEDKLLIHMTYHDGRLYIKATGYVTKLDPYTKQLYLTDQTNEIKQINLSAVRSIERA